MHKVIKNRIKKGHQALPFPPVKPMPERFRGMPIVMPSRCEGGCDSCAKVCPTGAIGLNPLIMDLGKCVFCGACATACPTKAISFSQDLPMSFTQRDDMRLRGEQLRLASELDKKSRRLFGRSLKLRVVTAGSCAGCDAEVNASGNIQFDIARFGVQVVASPRHADGLIVTGPVSANMRLALEKTYAAIAEPKLVIALGSCAIGGGPFAGSKEVHCGVMEILPVDLFIAGCPPHPMTIIDGIVRILGRI